MDRIVWNRECTLKEMDFFFKFYSLEKRWLIDIPNKGNSMSRRHNAALYKASQKNSGNCTKRKHSCTVKFSVLVKAGAHGNHIIVAGIY